MAAMLPHSLRRSPAEIAAITGHSYKHVNHILETTCLGQDNSRTLEASKEVMELAGRRARRGSRRELTPPVAGSFVTRSGADLGPLNDL